MTKAWIVLAIVLVGSAEVYAQNSLKSLAESLSRREREFRRYAMHWRWDLTHLSSSRSTGEGEAKADWQGCTLRVAPFKHGWIVSGTRKYSSAPLKSESYQKVLLIETPTGYIGHEGGPGALVVTPLSFRAEISLLPTLMLSGLNPLRYMEPSSISVRREGAYTRVDATVDAELWRSTHPEQITLWLDTARSLAPVKLVWTSASMSGEVSVSTFVKRGSVSIPTSFTYAIFVGRVPHDRLVYRLDRVEKATNQQPTWLREGDVISDWRLGLGEANLVWYHFRNWRLPTKSALLQLQSEQSTLTPSHENGKRNEMLPRFMPSTLLILIGALWYWRLKVKKAA